ncbi:MAG: DUF4388 domain-containing protein [Vicinamibacteria bacterium]
MASKLWFYAEGAARRGPVSLDDLIGRLATGQLAPDALVWAHGLAAWAPAAAVPELAERLAPPLPAAPPPPVAQTPPAAVLADVLVGAAPAPAPEVAVADVEDLLIGAAPAPAQAAAPQENPFLAELRERYRMNVRVFAQLAEELRKDGQLDEAIRVCREGLLAHPTYASARVTLGRALLELGRPEDAREALADAAKLSPRSALARRALGECLEKLGAGAEAREEYRAALALEPHNAALRAMLTALGDEVPADPGALAEALTDAGPGAAPDREDTGELPPIKLVEAEESFELLDPYDIPSVWSGPGAGGTPAAGVEGEPVYGGETPLETSPALEAQARAQALKAASADAAAGSGAADDIAGADEAEPPTPDAEADEDSPEWPPHDLAESDFAELVQALYEQRFSGLVVLTKPGVEKRVRVKDGRLVFASSSNPDERLGELLLRQGRIGYRQFVDASAGIRPGRRFGSVLVELGVLDPSELVRAVVDHTREIICEAFEWTHGHYHLVEGEDAAEDITLRMSAADLVLEGVRRVKGWSRVSRGAGPLDARYLRAAGWQELLRKATLSAEERAVIEAHEEVRDVETICKLSPLSSFETCRLVWALRVTGVLLRVPPELP